MLDQNGSESSYHCRILMPALRPISLVSQTGATALLLVLGLVATAGLAWEALDGSRTARATAEGVLRTTRVPAK
jgi:hypothetical protein